jgi:hypothetical protein
MNNQRRKKLREWVKKARDLKSELEDITMEEELAFDSMPEGLQTTTNGMNSEEAIDKLNEAIECVEESIDCVNEII